MSLVVTATCHSEDHKVEIMLFDATPWFEQAEDTELLDLHREGYEGKHIAGEVVYFCGDIAEGVKEMLEYIDLVSGPTGETRGHVSCGGMP
jgi:hypothetical protein